MKWKEVNLKEFYEEKKEEAKREKKTKRKID